MARAPAPLTMDESARQPIEDAFAHAAFLRRVARALVRDDHHAEDVVQSTWVRALERPPEGRPDALRSWLRRVATNIARNEARDAQRRADREQLAARPSDDEGPASDEALEQLDGQRFVLDLVLSLREPYRTAIYLRYYEELPPSAIAERLGVPVKTVKTRLSRALGDLRTRLREDERGNRWTLAVAGIPPVDRPEGTSLSAATTAGLVMSLKPIVVTIAVAAGVMLLITWPRRSAPAPVVPSDRTSVQQRVHEVETAAVQGPPPQPRAPAPNTAAAAARSPIEQASWRLELELAGWDSRDSGPLSVSVKPWPGESGQLSTEHPLGESVHADLGSLFEVPEKRPEILRVRLRHPNYRPRTFGILVPEDLREATATSGVLRARCKLDRADGIVTGTVRAIRGARYKRLTVSLHALHGDRPAKAATDATTVDRDGSYRLRTHGAERYALVAYAEPDRRRPGPPMRPETRVFHAPRNESTLELDPIELGRGHAIAGHVTFPGTPSHLSGEAVAELLDSTGPFVGSLVWQGERFENREVSAAWDANGDFEVSGLGAALYRVLPRTQRTSGGRPDLRVAYEPRQQRVRAPNRGVTFSIELTRVDILVTTDGRPSVGTQVWVRTRHDEHNESWTGRNTSRSGQVSFIVDATRTLHCKVDDGERPVQRIEYSSRELRAGPLKIQLDDVVPTPASLEIYLGERGAELLQGCYMDVHFFDRSDEHAFRGTSTTSGPRSMAVLANRHEKIEVSVDRDRQTQTVSGIPPASYVVRLAPRSAAPRDPCFLLPAEFEIDLAPGEHASYEWQPETGGLVRIQVEGENVGARLITTKEQLGSRYFEHIRQASGLPGIHSTTQAIPAGTYDILVERDGEPILTRSASVQAGRVNDVVLDVPRDDS